MNKELIRQWVKALRSGDYKQGRKALRNIDDTYCCLGVLCDIAKDKLRMKWERDAREPEIYTIDGNGGVLPSSIYEYLGKTDELNSDKVKISWSNLKLPSNIRDEDLKRNYVYLVTLNDQYHLSFEQIADIIEEEFLE